MSSDFSVLVTSPLSRRVFLPGEPNMEKRYALLLLLILALAFPALGQSNYAVITGTVTDAQQLPVTGASVELTAASTGATRRAVTNQQGLFDAPALLPDDYELQVTAQGFAASRQKLRLEVGQKMAVNVALRVG